MYLARRLRGKKSNLIISYPSSAQLSVRYPLRICFSLLLVQVNMTSFTEKAHELLGKRNSTSIIGFANLILRSFNPYWAV